MLVRGKPSVVRFLFGQAGTVRRPLPGLFADILFVSPALLLIGLLYLLPLAQLLALSLGAPRLTLSNYGELLEASPYVAVLIRSIRISIEVVLGCLLFGYPIAYLLAFGRPKLRQFLLLLVLLPFWTSILVRNYSWVYLLQRRGLLNETLMYAGIISRPLELMFNEAGVVIGMTNALLPFMVLPIFVALRAQDRALLEAAESLGAPPSRIFLAVVLPLSLSGVTAGSLLVFSTALGFFITPALLGGGRVLMAATFITQQVEELLNWPFAAAAAIVLLALVVLIVALYTRVMPVDKLWET